MSFAIASSALAQAQARAQTQTPVEPLSPEVLAQIAALQQQKASRTPAEQKISSRLLYAIKQQRGEPLPAGVSLRVPSLADTGGRIDAEIHEMQDHLAAAARQPRRCPRATAPSARFEPPAGGDGGVQRSSRACDLGSRGHEASFDRWLASTVLLVRLGGYSHDDDRHRQIGCARGAAGRE
jgi:hypothetical protein